MSYFLNCTKTLLVIALILTGCSSTPKPLPPRVNMVTIAVQDLKKMSDFFDQLGWPRSARSNTHHISFQTGGAVLSLWQKENFEKLGMKKNFQYFSGVLLSIYVETPDLVDQSLAKAKTAGATIVSPAKTTSYSGRSGSFKDIEGNIWEVTWAEGVTFQSSGTLDSY
jgi:uncharacterized protein